MLDATKVSKEEEHKDSSPKPAAKDTAEPASPVNFLDVITDVFKDVASQSHFTTTKHKSITEQGLIPAGLSGGARFAVEVGDLAQDLDSSTRAMPTHHFDDNTLAKSLAGVEESQARIAKMLAKPKLSEDDQVKILHEFGQRLHTLQDFYAHSNYVELNLKDNQNLRPQQIPLMNFDDISSGKAGQIHTGFYYYKNSWQNESTEFYLGRSGIINHLDQLGMKIPGTEYLPTADYNKLGSFPDRLNYFTDPRYSVLHFDLNKDDESADEGKLVDPKTGIKLHDYARELAVRETRRQWSQFEDTVHNVRGQAEGDKFLKQIKNMSFTNASLRSLRYSIDGIITWMS